MVDILDTLVAENRKLQREVKELRNRLQALERSRWLRMNPRRLLRIPTRKNSSPTVGETKVERRSNEDEHSDRAERFRREVLDRGDFTEHWFVRHAVRWERIFAELEGQAARVLEIGSFEGMSATFFLWRLPDSVLTCVDTFEGGLEHRTTADLSDLERRFDANVALIDESRVTKLVGDSKRILADLLAKNAMFDLIYVDGSHLGLDVLADAALSWQLLAPTGFVVFDDYRWAELGDDPLLRPGPAIEAFRTLIDGKHEVVLDGHQLGLRKGVEPVG